MQIRFLSIVKNAANTFLVLSLITGSTLLAQNQPPPATSDEEATAQKTTVTPAKWTEDLTVGAQIDDGRANTKAINIAGDIWEKYGDGILRFDVGEGYGSITSSGVRITSMNRQFASFSWTHDLSKRYYFTQIDSIERDTIRLIDYRAASLNALGVRLKGKKVSFDFGPGIAPVVQEKYTPKIDGAKVDVGAFYSLVYTIDPRWTVTHWASYRSDVSYAADRLIDSSISLTGMITKGIGLKVSAVYNYEGVIATGNLRFGFNTKNYLTTTVALTLHH
jgi:putative salt-induced outer membrane protein YdiY